MPFVADGGGGAGAPAAAPVAMHVAPEQILALKARYEEVRDTIHAFILQEEFTLVDAPAMADDEVSQDAAGTFSANATVALEVTRKFIIELDHNIEQLDNAAKTYRLVEDTNTDAMRPQARGI
ncbi:PE family protein [Actinosynnema sp. NPDC047251]|uniref:PE domain-containing protein n=1 Tax=Saccharothrix espanaensis (strain ATCC 51144 / DSM 44229 / JCM 9112 / NBRC 15066 / NRRL 15764) TaxID=1179773 RepID=K0JUJ1_SACES|nr:PE family protein [Saccharothrix espanaensis]CCH29162.1 hypothetical protein BN6_18420 [Saccharothrix espanaensis DSM 44229]